MIDRNDSIQVLNREERLSWLLQVLRIFRKIIVNAEILDNSTGQLNCMLFVMSQVISDT